MAVISFKCPNCDGELKFNPSGQNYVCEYCGSKFTQLELDDMKRAETAEQEIPDDFTVSSVEIEGIHVSANGGDDGSFVDQDHNGIDDRFESFQQFYEGKDKEEAKLYSCPSCGAEVVTDATTVATFCYYCHNPVVLGGRLEGNYLPRYIIPFQLDRKEAEKRFFDYVNKKLYVPKGFFSPENMEKFTGVYFPYWLYEVELKGSLDADAKNVRTWRSGDVEYTETKRYQVGRAGKITLKNRIENALKKANIDLIHGVLPFDIDKKQEFNMGFLSGFFAEKRDIETKDVETKIRNEMRSQAEAAFRNTMKYSSVTIKNSDFKALRETWDYVMLPVWTLTYRGKDGEIYYFAMNGQDGKVFGKLPVDKKKLAIHSLLIGLVIAIICFGIGFVGGM